MAGFWAAASAAPALAQADEPAQLAQSPAAGGLGFLTPGEWGTVRVVIENPSDQPTDATAVVSPLDDSLQQHAVQVWLPPRSRRAVQMPMRLPATGVDGNSIDVQGRVVVGSAGRERGDAPQVGALLIRDDPVSSAVMADTDDDDAITLHRLLRESANLEPGAAYVTPQRLPQDTAGLDAIELFWISRDTPSFDPAQARSLRQWLQGGGRLWLAMDQVDPDWLATLGPPMDGLVWAEPIELDRPTLTGDTLADDVRVQGDYPYPMRPLLDPPGEVLLRADGLPALVRLPAGRGAVMLLTVHPSLLLAAAEQAGGEAVSPVVQAVAGWYRGPVTGGGPAASRATPNAVEVFGAYAPRQVGYEVLGRGLVVGVLAGFAVLIAAAGLWFGRRGKLEYAAAAAAGLAVAAAVVLLVLGRLQQGAAPTTVATVELLELGEDGSSGRSDRLVSVYRTAGSPALDQLSGGGGMPELVRQDTGANINRLVSTDLDRWRYDSLPLPPGTLHSLRLGGLATLDEPAGAELSLGEFGITGELTGPAAMLEDVVLALPGGAFAVSAGSEGRFDAEAGDALPPGQFLRQTILSDRQIARQDVYRRLLTGPPVQGEAMPRGGLTYPPQPSILGWRDRPAAVDEVALGEDELVRGETLMVLPVRWRSPEAGTQAAVPWQAMRMTVPRGVRVPGGGGTIFDPATGRWVTGISNPQTVLMRFEPPPVVRGLGLSGATLHIELEAPGRPVEVVTLGRNGQAVRALDVELTADARQQLQLPVDRLYVDDAGGYLLGLRIGAADDPPGEPWSLHHLGLSLRGTAGQSSSTD